ncbi:MAG: ribonuclease E/G [Alphaproteobacteria bacterium]|nr:ribonuclease E/G [Alphaproteobacteria bacterium]
MNADTIVYEKKDEVVRLAVLQNGQMVEFDTYNKHAAIEGNVYLGRLTHKMELASGNVGFKVNVGDTVEGFLNLGGFDTKDINLSEGQSIVVQVAQEKRAEKGAKLTRQIQIVGTTVVYKPFYTRVDISQKITDKEKVKSLYSLVRHNMKGQEGWAVRTSAADFEPEMIVEEMQKLRSVYEKIRMRARSATAPAILYMGEDPLYEYIRRHKNSLKKIVVNNHNIVEEIKETVDNIKCANHWRQPVESELKADFQSDWQAQLGGNGDTSGVSRMVLHFEVEYCANPFEEYGLEDQLIEALNPSIALKSGGKVYIQQTKACVTIDVDSGSLREGANINELNREAAVEIARQIRLKNLSGKIVIDFAGDKDYQYMKPVMDTLETELADDPSRGRVVGLSKAGNIEILRQRRRPSLIDTYTDECPTCQGTGRVEK